MLGAIQKIWDGASCIENWGVNGRKLDLVTAIEVNGLYVA